MSAKYGNKRVVTADGAFDSQAEYARWCELVALERAGLVMDLRRQPEYVLSVWPRCVYTPDADYREEVPPDQGGGWRLVLEDVKGAAAPRDVFVRIAWVLNEHTEVECVRLLRRAGPRSEVKRGWRLVAGWLVREYARVPAKKRRRAA